jgi:HPt (histidine-containing phosphotransfer) domain-containing protein
METLATFIDDGRERIFMLKDCLDKEDLALYAVCVHALKSASASIGADELSEAAYALELAAKLEDEEFIKSKHDEFISDLEWLVGRIERAVGEYGERNGKNVGYHNPEALKPELEALAAALEIMDAGAINALITKVQNSARTEDVLAAARSISTKILMSEYDAAIKQIKELLKTI